MKVFSRILKGLDKALAYPQKLLLILVTIIVVCTVSIEVVARYLFQAPIWGMEEITGHTAVWLYMIGASYGTYDRSHIMAEFIHLIVKNQRILDIFRILAASISVVICSFMTTWSYKYVNWSLTRHETTPALHLPTVYFQISILISSLLMALYFAVELVDLIRSAYSHRSVE